MGSLANISGKEAVKAFLHAGWVHEGQTGSHVIPQHKEVKPGTLRGIPRAADMTVDEFLELL
jgi:predicted RNA binding protein YcfA (HicA-like mRNA interferase family)